MPEFECRICHNPNHLTVHHNKGVLMLTSAILAVSSAVTIGLSVVAGDYAASVFGFFGAVVSLLIGLDIESVPWKR